MDSFLTDLNIFMPGQVWKYNNRAGEDDSTLTILEIEEFANDVVVHIRIDGIHLPLANGNTTDHIGHVPILETALKNSLIRFLGHLNGLPDFFEGYTQWKNAFDAGKAGYWKIPVNEVVDAVCQLSAG